MTEKLPFPLIFAIFALAEVKGEGNLAFHCPKSKYFLLSGCFQSKRILGSAHPWMWQPKAIDTHNDFLNDNNHYLVLEEHWIIKYDKMMLPTLMSGSIPFVFGSYTHTSVEGEN